MWSCTELYCRIKATTSCLVSINIVLGKLGDDGLTIETPLLVGFKANVRGVFVGRAAEWRVGVALALCCRVKATSSCLVCINMLPVGKLGNIRCTIYILCANGADHVVVVVSSPQ